MQILPLRNMVLVRFQDEETRTDSGLELVRDPRLVRPAVVIACGPDVRDIYECQVVLINTAAGTVIAGQLLIPEHAILGTL